jgi:hypothetical protein
VFEPEPPIGSLLPLPEVPLPDVPPVSVPFESEPRERLRRLLPDPFEPLPVEPGDLDEPEPVPLVPEPLPPMLSLPDSAPVAPVPEPLVSLPVPLAPLPDPLAPEPDPCAFANVGVARNPDNVSATSIFRMTVSFCDFCRRDIDFSTGICACRAPATSA